MTASHYITALPAPYKPLLLADLRPRSLTRQMWLEAAVVALRERFEQAGYAVPATVRVSIGFPKGSGGRSKAIGQCWANECSTDQYNEIFISPELGGASIGPRIMGVLAHELAHATVGVQAGHKAPFKQCAVAVGLTGKMTATIETDEFNTWAATVIERIGPYPAGAMSTMSRKKQTTRLLKCECAECGYTVRISKKWLDVAMPVCPTDEEPMRCDAVGDGDGDSDDE
jgi:hypothetical protein